MLLTFIEEISMPEISERVVVKLRSDLQIPYVDHAEQFLPGFQALLAAFPPLELNRYYTAFEPNELQAQLEELQGQVAQAPPPLRSEERRVGNALGRACRS